MTLDGLEAVRRLAAKASPQIALRRSLTIFSERLVTITSTAVAAPVVGLFNTFFTITARLVAQVLRFARVAFKNAGVGHPFSSGALHAKAFAANRTFLRRDMFFTNRTDGCALRFLGHGLVLF